AAPRVPPAVRPRQSSPRCRGLAKRPVRALRGARPARGSPACARRRGDDAACGSYALSAPGDRALSSVLSSGGTFIHVALAPDVPALDGDTPGLTALRRAA